MQSPAQLLNEQMAYQASMEPSVEDQSQWLTRYLFVPFRDRPFSTEYIQEYCGLKGLRAGQIIPIQRGRQMIPDYDQIGKVPKGLENRGPYGLSAMKSVEKTPALMVESLLQTFNPHHGTDPQQDNGICEIVELRGQTDSQAIFDIQMYCLPEFYKTAREQVTQLERAANNQRGDVPPLFLSVAGRLLASTEIAKTWAGWHVEALEAAMDNKAETGKDRASPLDAAVCHWIGVPVPKYRSQLQQPLQTMGNVPAAVIPQLWCGECGALSNLGPNGEKPRRCAACQTPFEAQETVVGSPSANDGSFPVDAVLLVSASGVQSPGAPSVSESRTERLQRESRERKGK